MFWSFNIHTNVTTHLFQSCPLSSKSSRRGSGDYTFLVSGSCMFTSNIRGHVPEPHTLSFESNLKLSILTFHSLDSQSSPLSKVVKSPPTKQTKIRSDSHVSESFIRNPNFCGTPTKERGESRDPLLRVRSRT